jgi:hypothetical protein
MTMVEVGATTEDHLDGREAVHTPRNSSLESIVTTAFNVEAQSGNGAPSEGAKLVAIVVLGLGVAGFLALAGITLLSLALALPIAVAVADTYGVYVSASDVATATQLATFAPAFVVAGIATLVASLVTMVKLIQRIDRSPSA